MFLRRQVFDQCVLPSMTLWLSNVVIVKSDGSEVENSSKSHGEEDVKFENKR